MSYLILDTLNNCEYNRISDKWFVKLFSRLSFISFTIANILLWNWMNFIIEFNKQYEFLLNSEWNRRNLCDLCVGILCIRIPLRITKLKVDSKCYEIKLIIELKFLPWNVGCKYRKVCRCMNIFQHFFWIYF